MTNENARQNGLVRSQSGTVPVTVAELETLFGDIVPFLANGEVTVRDARTVFILAPRVDWQTSDLLRVLAMLEKSSEWSSEAMAVIQLLLDIINGLRSGQIPLGIGAQMDAVGVVGEVVETTRTVRLSSVGASVLRSVSADARPSVQPHDAVRISGQSPTPKPALPPEFENVESDDRTDAKRTADTRKKERKEYVKDARERADRYLRRYVKRHGSTAGLSGQQLADRLGISKTVACEALADARPLSTGDA